MPIDTSFDSDLPRQWVADAKLCKTTPLDPRLQALGTPFVHNGVGVNRLEYFRGSVLKILESGTSTPASPLSLRDSIVTAFDKALPNYRAGLNADLQEQLERGIDRDIERFAESDEKDPVTAQAYTLSMKNPAASYGVSAATS